MNDLSAFAEPDFEPKAWVNTLASQRHSAEEPIDKFLAEMEMRLQLAAEEIEAGLHESSAQALRRLPFAVQEIYRLQGDIQGMQDQVRVLAVHAGQNASAASESVSRIKELDRVKRNMEAACSTLKEATELSGMFIKVEDVFASGDLPRVAQLLRSMRASLALVGDVPEFRAGRSKLRALEDRLQSQVEGALAAALAAPAGVQPYGSGSAAGGAEGPEEHTRALCGLLLAVDRYQTIETLYVDTRLARIHALWEELSVPQGPGVSVGQWLPAFYARLLPLLRAEVAWAARVLPQQRADITHALLKACFEKISRAVTQRLADRSVPILALISLTADLTGFATHVAELLPAELPAAQRSDLLALLLVPLEDGVTRYASLEAALLESELQAALPDALPGAAAAPVLEGEALVRKLWDVVRSAASSCCAAIDRCMQLTGGSELPALAGVLDEVLATLISRITSRASQAAAKAGALAASHATSAAHSLDESAEEVGTTLRLVVLSDEVAGGTLLHKVDAALRAALAAALPRLSAGPTVPPAAAATPTSAAAAGAGLLQHTAAAAVGGARPGAQHGVAAAAVVDPVALRMVRAPERLQRVQRLAGSLADPRYSPLPQATNQADTLGRTAQSGALDALLARVRAALRPLPTLPQWPVKRGGGTAALPTFSVEPLPYVTHVGDYLMMLPQQLEMLFADELLGGVMSQDEQDDLAAQWLDRVVAGAASAYYEAITHIPDLSPQGGVQLAADVEYFCNVMSALHVAPPPSLLTLQLFAGMSDTDLPTNSKQAVTDGGADPAALRTLVNLRHLQVQFGGSAAPM